MVLLSAAGILRLLFSLRIHLVFVQVVDPGAAQMFLAGNIPGNRVDADHIAALCPSVF